MIYKFLDFRLQGMAVILYKIAQKRCFSGAEEDY